MPDNNERRELFQRTDLTREARHHCKTRIPATTSSNDRLVFPSTNRSDLDEHLQEAQRPATAQQFMRCPGPVIWRRRGTAGNDEGPAAPFSAELDARGIEKGVRLPAKIFLTRTRRRRSADVRPRLTGNWPSEHDRLDHAAVALYTDAGLDLRPQRLELHRVLAAALLQRQQHHANWPPRSMFARLDDFPQTRSGSAVIDVSCRHFFRSFQRHDRIRQPSGRADWLIFP